MRDRMEQAFGTDFGQVRIHQNSALAPELGAVAFTQGTRIHFASGAYAPGSRTGTNLLAHELTHVVQQTGSAVRRAPVPAATRIRARPGAPWVIRPRRTLHGVSVEDTKADAVSQHAADRKALMAAVDAGATQTSDEVLRNACQWIREATNADVLRIYALTPTHDSDVRAQALTNDPGTIRLAYFGRDAQGNNGALYPLTARQPVADYDEGNTSDPRVRDFARTSAALIGDSVIVFLSPGTRDREEIYQTIRHEVQHKADFNEATGGLTQAEALETYRTEFRAHWVERRPAFEQSDSTEDDLPGRLLENQGTPEASKYDGWNQRQMLIFDSIYSHPSYAVVKRYWDPATNPDAGPRAAFQQAIFNIKRLDSPNPRNSLRVQKFFVALGALTAQTNVGDAAVTAIGTMIDSAPFTRQDALDIQAAGKYRTLAASARANAGPVSAAVLNHIDGLLSDKASFLPTSFARFARGLF